MAPWEMKFLYGIPLNHNFRVAWSIVKPISQSEQPNMFVWVDSFLFNRPDNPVLDFDWTATPDGQSILSVGFSHHILLLYQQRMTYFDQEPGWGVFRRIEIEK